jgi:hypothetical protein
MEPPASSTDLGGSILIRSWMTEMERGFMSTAVEHELGDPKL